MLVLEKVKKKREKNGQGKEKGLTKKMEFAITEGALFGCELAGGEDGGNDEPENAGDVWY